MNIASLPGLPAFYQSFTDISFGNQLAITPGDREVVISGDVPCIRRDKWDSVRPVLESWDTNPAHGRILGRYILARVLDGFRMGRRGDKPVPNELIFDVSVGAAILASRFFVGADKSKELSLELATAHIAHLEARVAEARSEIAAFREQRRAIRIELQELATEPKAIRTEITQYRSEAATAAAALRVQIGLNETQKLWRNQAKQGARAYYISLAFLLVMFAFSAAVVWAFSGNLIAFLGEIEAFSTGPEVPAPVVYVLAIGRLLLITGPIALLVWAAKLIVRFNLRSLLLMDDATHRVTMLDTYLFLVTKEAVTVQDRGALLEAMFRRAPGHGPETVEPPNMADIMRYGDVVGGGPKN